MSSGGAERDRTADPLLAKQVLSQLSYSPKDSWCSNGRFMQLVRLIALLEPFSPASTVAATGQADFPLRPLVERVVGLGRFELPTSPLSGVRSNQLSYRPILAGSPAE